MNNGEIMAAAITPPVIGEFKFKSKTWDSVTTTVRVDSFGNPADSPDRFLEVIAVKSETGRRLENKRYFLRAPQAGINYDITIARGENTHPDPDLPDTLEILGMTHLKMILIVDNDINNPDGNGAVQRPLGEDIYLPPRPGRLSYSAATTPGKYIVTYLSSRTFNDLDYDRSQHKVVFKIVYPDGSEKVIERPNSALGTEEKLEVEVAPSTEVTIEVYQEYYDAKSEISSVKLTNSNAPVLIRVPVEEGGKIIGKKADRLFYPIDGKSKRLFKVYESVDGVAKIAHLDLERPKYDVGISKPAYEVGNLFGDTVVNRQGTISITVNPDTFPDYQDPADFGFNFAVYIGTKDFTEITITLDGAYFATITPKNVREKQGALCAYFQVMDGLLRIL